MKRCPPPHPGTRRWPLGFYRAARVQSPVSRAAVDNLKLAFCREYTGVQTRSLQRALETLVERGVTGLGFGAKVKGDRVVALGCLRVYVPRKRKRLGLRERIPERVGRGRVPVDVIELPSVVPHLAKGGDSVRHQPSATTGTFGCLVSRVGRRFILSNNHVLADLNRGKPNDAIFQPGTEPGSLFAKLTDFELLAFEPAPANLMDAAIAELVNPAAASARINEIGQLSGGIATAHDGLRVQKYGMTSLRTHGIIEGIHEDFPLPYDGRRAWFRGQIGIRYIGEVFSEPGDSGSLVVTESSNQPVGLLFGADLAAGLSFCTPLQIILERFGVTLVT